MENLPPPVTVTQASDVTVIGLNIELENPFFHHLSDNPGMMLVSGILTGDNYIPWKRAMTVALSAKNKLNFINVNILKPALDDPSYGIWERVNNRVLSWILNSIHKEIVSFVIYCDTAYDSRKCFHRPMGQGFTPLRDQ